MAELNLPTVPKAGEDAEKLDHSHLISENVN